MITCANSIPITFLFSNTCWESPAQRVGGCCALPQSHQPLRDTQLSHGKSNQLLTLLELALPVPWCSEMSSPVRFLLAKEEQLVTWCEHYSTNTGFGPPPRGDCTALKRSGLCFPLSQPGCLQSVQLLSKVSCCLARACALPDPELEVWSKLFFIAVLY